MKALWKNQVIAESETFESVENNIYFPRAALMPEFFKPSETHTTCSWKGVASYYDVVVGTETNKDAAWFYPTPTEAAANIKDHVAFWRGVEIQK